jgi:copper transporter 1
MEHGGNEMRMYFYWGTQIEEMIAPWLKTENVSIYLGVLIVFFFFGLFGELFHTLTNRKYMYKTRIFQFCVLFAKTIVYILHLMTGYIVMLSLMSYNIGIFVSIVLGHMVGFIAFTLPEIMTPPPKKNHNE